VSRCPGPAAALALAIGLVAWDAPAAAQAPTHPCEIRIESGDQIVDLGRDLVTRWHGPSRPYRAHVALSPAEKDTLCSILFQGHALDLPGVVGTGGHSSPPAVEWRIVLHLGSRSNELLWFPDWNPSVRPGKAGPDPRQDVLFDFKFRLDRMLQRNAAYRRMPWGPPRL
jgi:hypothetical protein